MSVIYYERHFSLLLKELDLRMISQGKKHLDFGCGEGAFAGMLARRYPDLHVVGIDANKKSINTARKKHDLPNLNFIQSQKITQMYDSINVFSVIHEIDIDINDYLKSFYEHLNKNGKIIIFDYQKTSREEYRILYEEKKDLDWVKSFEEDYAQHNQWTLKQFQKIMEKIGFKAIKIEPIGKYKFLYVGRKD